MRIDDSQSPDAGLRHGGGPRWRRDRGPHRPTLEAGSVGRPVLPCLRLLPSVIIRPHGELLQADDVDRDSSGAGAIGTANPSFRRKNVTGTERDGSFLL